MDDFQTLINSGYVSFRTDVAEFDTAVYVEPHVFNVVRTVSNVKIVVYDSDDDKGEIYPEDNTLTDNIECHGRVCILLDDLSYELTAEPYVGLQDFSGSAKIFGIDENGQMRQYGGTSSGWNNRDAGFYTVYTGERQPPANWFINGYLNQYPYDRFFQNDTAFGHSILKYGQSVTLTCNVPLFYNVEQVIRYIETGDPSESINKSNYVEKVVYYYDYDESNIRTSDNSLYNTTNYSAKIKLINTGDKIRYVKTSNDTADLLCNNSEVLTLVNGNWVTTNFNTLKQHVILNTSYNNLYGVLDTNIPIVENFDDDINDSENTIIITPPNYTGETGIMNPESLVGVISPLTCFQLSQSEFSTIKNWLYHADAQIIEVLKEGLWQYAENPIDCVIDICYMPFNIDDYVVKQSKHLQFGSLVFNGTIEGIPSLSFNNIVTSSKMVTNVNVKIVPTYNDYRDFDLIKYSVYMPYYGILELDSSCVNKTLTIKTFYDAWSSTLKYYVFIAGALVGEYSCDVGKHISVNGTNWVGKSKENTNTALSMIPTVDLSGINIPSANDIVEGTMQMLSKPKTMTAGTISTGININDDMNFYLIVEQNESVAPPNLYSEYGIPCYKISNLTTCKGFTKISDIKLKTRALDTEYNEIVNILKNGIII